MYDDDDMPEVDFIDEDESEDIEDEILAEFEESEAA